MAKKPLLLFLIVANLLAACKSEPSKTSSGTQTPSTTESVVSPADKIAIRFAASDSDLSRYEDLVERFEAGNPSIEVKMVSTDKALGLSERQRNWPDDGWLRLASAADVILLMPWDNAAAPSILRDLNPLIEDDPTLDLDDFYPGTPTSCQQGETLWCVPLSANQLFIFYDKEAFDRADTPYPEAGWTWDDLLAKATALTARRGDKVTRWGFILHPFFYLPLVENRAGLLIDTTADPPAPRFDRPKVAEAVRWFNDLILVHGVAPLYTNMEEAMLAYALIEDQKVAMWPSEFFDWQWLHEHRNIGIVPLPGDTPVWSWDRVAMSAGTAHPEAAWRWIKALGQAVPETYGLRLLPARRSVAEEAGGFLERVDEQTAAALHYAEKHGYGTHWIPNRGDVSWVPGYSTFPEAVAATLSGERSVEEALAEVQTLAQAALLEDSARRAQATPVPAFGVVSPETPPPGAVSIAFYSSSFIGLGPGVLQTYRALAQEFQELHPDITVELKTTGQHTRSMPDAARECDCFTWLPTFEEPANLEAILSLEPFLEADPAFDLDDFYPALLQPFFWQGQLRGLPGQAKPTVLLYNRDLFDAAGVTYPPVDWTTDDFLQVLVALTQGEGEEKRYGFVGSPLESQELALFLERRGARLVDESTEPPTVRLTDPATVEALRWYTDLSTTYGVKPLFSAKLEDVTTVYMERQMLINNSRAAMWAPLESWELISDEMPFDLGVATLPAGADGAAGAYDYVDGYFISAHSTAPQACWLWITFLTTQPEAAWGVPARRSVVESEAYRQWVGEERAAVYEVSVANADRAPTSTLYRDQAWLWLFAAMVWLGQAHNQVVAGQATVEEALATAQRFFDDYRACIIAHDAFTDSEIQQACAVEADPTLADFISGP